MTHLSYLLFRLLVPTSRKPQEENKALYRRTFKEIFNQGNLALVDELVAPDFLNHEVPPNMNNRGPDSTRQVVTMLRTAFPDLHFTIEELVAEGDTVAGRMTMSGTHLGLFQGIPPRPHHRSLYVVGAFKLANV